MQVMGHTDPQIYRRYYLNQIITTDTLACFLGSPSRDGLMRLASHMSLTRDSNAPNTLTPAQKEEVHTHHLVQSAMYLYDQARIVFISKHTKLRFTKVADPKAHSEYLILQRSFRAIQNKIAEKETSVTTFLSRQALAISNSSIVGIIRARARP